MTLASALETGLHAAIRAVTGDVASLKRKDQSLLKKIKRNTKVKRGWIKRADLVTVIAEVWFIAILGKVAILIALEAPDIIKLR